MIIIIILPIFIRIDKILNNRYFTMLRKIILILWGAGWLTVGSVHAAEVNLYTDRQAVFFAPILAVFEAETGIKVQALYLKKGLLERVRAEQNNPVADVIYAVDAGYLDDFAREGLLAPLPPQVDLSNLSADLHTDKWFGVTRRARVLYVSKGLAVERYEDLAVLPNTVCLRNGKHRYNIALFADLIARWGEGRFRQWLIGVRDSLARPTGSNDSGQIKGVVNGACGVGLANHYYYYKVKQQTPDIDEFLTVIFPPQVHVNVNGAGLATDAPHKAAATKLLQFLSSLSAQALFAKHNREFPARDDATVPADMQADFAKIKQGASLADISKYRARAASIVDEVGLNAR